MVRAQNTRRHFENIAPKITPKPAPRPAKTRPKPPPNAPRSKRDERDRRKSKMRCPPAPPRRNEMRPGDEMRWPAAPEKSAPPVLRCGAPPPRGIPDRAMPPRSEPRPGDRGAPIYLDHNATTPPLPEAVEAMLPFFREHF